MMVMLFNSIRISFTYLHYYLDPAGFIEKLCENKDKPELACNGQCYLMKVLQQKDQEQKKQGDEIAFKEITLFVEKEFDTFIIPLDFYQKKELPSYQNLYSFIGQFHLFHPPQQA